MTDSSSVVFKSNVYPVKPPVTSDKQFLSRIIDYEKLRGLNELLAPVDRYSAWTNFQRTIIDKGKNCSEAKDDPCWGPVGSGAGQKWICKCVNIKCEGFSGCREGLVDKNEIELFSPYMQSIEGYGYDDGMGTGDQPAAIFFGEDVFYSTDEYFSRKQVKGIRVEPPEAAKGIDIVKVVDAQKPYDCVSNWEANAGLNDVDPGAEGNMVQGSGVTIATMPSGGVDNVCVVMPENIYESFVCVEQEQIIKADFGEALFVDAGPGTGKTYTLIEKINYMVSMRDVHPEDIIVLSFTNAAVSEIRTRLNSFVRGGGDRGLRNVDVRTFHSLAWWLLAQANDDVDLAEKGWKEHKLVSDENDYESSLKKAAELIRRFPEVIAGWNVVVDEVQDLTNEKAEFVLAIVDACLKDSNEITIFGDSCQAIYDYSNDAKTLEISSEQFYRRVYQRMLGKGHYYRLAVNHRQTEALQSLTETYRAAILSQELQRMQEEVQMLHKKIPSLGVTVTSITEMELRDLANEKSICLLCRNNGQTLRLSSVLRKKGIDHCVSAYEVKDNYAAWIAEAFFDYEDDFVTLEQMIALLSRKKISFPDRSAEDVWTWIRDHLDYRSEVISVPEMLEGIRKQRFNDKVFRTTTQHQIIVSTIHRAKGREYESVIIDDAYLRELEGTSETKVGEYKTLYVAVTRPKATLLHALLTNTKIVCYPKTDYYGAPARKRWGIYRNKHYTHLEFLYDHDVDRRTFLLDADADVNYYRSIQNGDEIRLRRVIVDGDPGHVKYKIFHVRGESETGLGYATQFLVKDLMRFIRAKSAVDMPHLIENLYVEGVYSYVAGVDFMAKDTEVQRKTRHGVWNWVDFRGMGHLLYDIY